MDDFDVMMEQLKALADPTRIKIFKLVESQELCVCQIVPAIGLSQPTVSVHLAKLKRAGLVKERKAAQWSYYSGDEAGISRFMRSLEAFLTAAPEDVPALKAIAAAVASNKACRL